MKEERGQVNGLDEEICSWTAGRRPQVVTTGSVRKRLGGLIDEYSRAA